ncbi:MAG TPA: PTS transporter subunit EIIB, partial [Candidatus Olsenella stercoravium]|nr:PTS transporter subunit EIIB [Candidatus Olsenella stercoravium]
MDRQQIAEEVLAAVGGKENVTANDICMTRLRILTQDPSLVDTDQL